MSREHRKNLKRGIKQSLVEREFRQRAERHGKPVTKRVRRVVTDPETNLVSVVFENVPVLGPTKHRVAAGPTGTWGLTNTGGPRAGKKSAPKPK